MRTLHAGFAGLMVMAALAGCSPRAPDAKTETPPTGAIQPLPPVGSYATSDEHFEALRKAANGGRKLAWDKLPDWSGIWTRKFEGPGFAFDPKAPQEPRLPPGYAKNTAQLTPAYQAMLEKKINEVAKGIEWDTLSNCLPAGHPRWLTEPFLKEAIVTPAETWWINEQQSEARRIYTDGRGHVAADEAYPMWEGDSIGFWNGDTLVVHTNNLKSGQYQRGQADYSEQTTTVEEIRKTGPDAMEDRITVYDPASLAKPWTVTIKFERVKTPGLRIAMWSCNENNNVVKDASGSSTFILPGEKGYKNPDNLAGSAKP
ncbi:MAG: hypothetical protein ABIO39_05910 [Caulobacteraceae bacterium]